MPSIQDKILEAQRLAANQDGNTKWGQMENGPRNEHSTPSQPNQQQVDPHMQQQLQPQVFGYDMYNQMMMQHQINQMGMPMGQMVQVDPNMQNPGWQNQGMMPMMQNQPSPGGHPPSHGSQGHVSSASGIPHGGQPGMQMGDPSMASQSSPASQNQPGSMIPGHPSNHHQQSPMQHQPQFSSPDKGHSKGKFAPSPPPQEAAPGSSSMPMSGAQIMQSGGKGSQPSQGSASGQMQGQMMGMMGPMGMMPNQGMMIPQPGQFGMPQQMVMVPQHVMMQQMQPFDEAGHPRDEKQRSGRVVRKDMGLPDEIQGNRRVRDPTRESWADVTDSPKGASNNIVLDINESQMFKTGKGKNANKGKRMFFAPQGQSQPVQPAFPGGFQGGFQAGFQPPMGGERMMDFTDDRKLGMDDRNLRNSLLEKQDGKGKGGKQKGMSDFVPDWGGKSGKNMEKGQKGGKDFGKGKNSGKGGKYEDSMNKGSKGKNKGFGGSKSTGKFDSSPRNGRRKDRELTEWFSQRMGSGQEESSGSQAQGRDSKGKGRGQWLAKAPTDEDVGDSGNDAQWKPKDSDEEKDDEERNNQQVKTDGRSSRQETSKRSVLSVEVEKRQSASSRKRETWTRKSKS